MDQRWVGIEFEISGQHYHDWFNLKTNNDILKEWRITTDGTIPPLYNKAKNKLYEGVEVISPKSYINVQLLSQIDFVFENMHNYKKFNDVNCTAFDHENGLYTGLHVHIDTRDFQDLHRAACVIWMQSMWDTLALKFPSILPSWRKRARWVRFNEFQPNHSVNEVWLRVYGEQAKYRAVNATAHLGGRNTIEFRLGFMSENKDEVVSWVKYCHDLVVLISKFNPSDLHKMKVSTLLEKIKEKHDSILPLEEEITQVAA